MNWLWKFLLHPVVFYISGSSNSYGGKGGLDVGDPLHIFPDNSMGNQMRRGTAGDPFGLWYKAPSRPETEAELAADEESRKTALRARIDKLYGVGDVNDPAVAASKAALDKEGTSISDATRAYYTDQLNRSFGAAERGSRFNLARQGLLGGSADSDKQTEVLTDRDLAATRIDEAVRKAVASLTTQREGERLNAVNLVNAGIGEPAIDAASSGLRTAFSNANNQNKADLFSDLFANTADAAATQNLNAQQAAQLARYKTSLGTFFPTNSGGGQVTATQ